MILITSRPISISKRRSRTGRRKACRPTRPGRFSPRRVARVADEELFDDQRAEEVYQRILALVPGAADIEEAVEKIQAKRSKWSDLVQRYADEAKSAAEPRLKSSMLVSAAEIAYRY